MEEKPTNGGNNWRVGDPSAAVNAMTLENLFAYGTLMCGDIMHEVSGVRLSPLAGTLQGFRRHSVRGEHYPAIVPNETGRVDGLVYRDVPRAAWVRLDRFEGEMYERSIVQVEMEDGSILPAATYVTLPKFLDRLDPSEWDFAEFLRTGKTSFQRGYSGYRWL